MWERFKNSVMDNWPAWLFTLLFGAGIATAVGFAGQVADMAVSYPLPLGVTCAASFLLGCLSTSALGLRDSMRVKAEKRCAEERERDQRARELAERADAEAAERERRERAVAREFMELDFPSKLFLTFLFDSGPRVIEHGGYGWGDVDSIHRDLCRQGWCTSETVLDGTRYGLSDRARRLLDAHQELMADAREVIAGPREEGEGC